MRDVLVVGGGINGLLCAYELNKVGLSVTVVDSGDIPNPFAASCGKHRIVHPFEEPPLANCRGGMEEVMTLWENLFSELETSSYCMIGVIGIATDNGSGFSKNVNYEELAPESIGKYVPAFQYGKFNKAYYFERYGVILADVLLMDIYQYLKTKGVEFISRFRVDRVDTLQSIIYGHSGIRLQANLLVIAAGTGTGKILDGDLNNQGSIENCQFTPTRCYVLYADEPGLYFSDRGQPAWVCSGEENLWGVPPISGIRLKLGCGSLSHPSDPDDHSCNKEVIVRRMRKLYEDRFPLMKSINPYLLTYNHWTHTGRGDIFFTRGNSVVVVSDSGFGFKLAPYTARQVRNEVIRNM